MTDRDKRPQDSPSLAHMMDLDLGAAPLWQPGELGAILAHQLSAPIEHDLAALDTGLAGRLAELGAAAGGALRTFRDVLAHPRPPLELLELIKTFAKACRSHPHSPLPDEVATVLYTLSIVVAINRCGRRLTTMDDQSLRYCVTWALEQPWLDDTSRRLLQEGWQAVSGPPRATAPSAGNSPSGC